MPTKTRPNTFSMGVCTVSNSFGTSTESGDFQIVDTCVDGAPQGDCGPLTITRLVDYKFPVQNGSRTVAGTTTTSTDFIPYGVRTAGWYNFPSYSGPTNGAFAAQLAARTNPSRTVVDFPAFVGELRDLPLLFKLQGDSIIKNAYGANLTLQFGWLPLVSDLKKLLDLTAVVDKRQAELERFYKSGLRRTLVLDELSSFSVSANKLISAKVNAQTYCDEYKSTKHTITGHIRWKPTTLPPRTSAEMRLLAMRAVLGLSVSSLAASAWELIPWSWLIDWFSSTGDFIKAYRNTVPATITHCVIMRQSDQTIEWKGLRQPTGFNTTEGFVKTTSKSRVSAVPSAEAYLPYLSARQISILESLIITRRKFYGR